MSDWSISGDSRVKNSQNGNSFIGGPNRAEGMPTIVDAKHENILVNVLA